MLARMPIISLYFATYFQKSHQIIFTSLLKKALELQLGGGHIFLGVLTTKGQ